MPCAKSSQISLGLHHRQVQCWRLSWFLHKQVHIFYQSFWDWIVPELLSQKALSFCQMPWWLRWGECKAYANCYMDGGYGDGEIEMSCSINIWFDSDGCLKIIVNNVISRALLSFSFVMITGPCADGYGVCCLNFVTACQSNVKKNVSYIQVNCWTLLSLTALSLWHHHHHHDHEHYCQNPDYPAGYSTTINTCDYFVQKCDDSVCQVLNIILIILILSAITMVWLLTL